jgi:hypothetical protein
MKLESRRAIFGAARNFHGAIVAYMRTMREGGDIESAAQAVVGASLRYRAALDEFMRLNPSAHAETLAFRRRIERLRKTLGFATRQYNLHKKRKAAVQMVAVGRAPAPVPSSRSSSARTVS